MLAGDVALATAQCKGEMLGVTEHSSQLGSGSGGGGGRSLHLYRLSWASRHCPAQRSSL